MAIHHHSKVNALTNPASAGDIIIAQSGERYQVYQTMSGEYWLRHVLSGADITRPAMGQVALVRQIAGLIDL